MKNSKKIVKYYIIKKHYKYIFIGLYIFIMVEDNDNTNTTTPITQPTSTTVIAVSQTTNDYVKIIEDLYIKYKNYPYVLHRLNLHIENLPATLEQEAENYEKRQNRNALLNNEQKTFIQVFLKKHQYFYHATNNTFLNMIINITRK